MIERRGKVSLFLKPELKVFKGSCRFLSYNKTAEEKDMYWGLKKVGASTSLLHIPGTVIDSIINLKIWFREQDFKII